MFPGAFSSSWPIICSGSEIGWGVYGIFRKPLKKAFQTCMVYGGGGGGGRGVAAKKIYSAGNMDGSGNFGPFPGILKARDRISIRFGSDVQVFSPEPP